MIISAQSSYPQLNIECNGLHQNLALQDEYPNLCPDTMFSFPLLEAGQSCGPQLRAPGDGLQNIDQVMQRSGAAGAGAGVAARRHEGPDSHHHFYSTSTNTWTLPAICSQL